MFLILRDFESTFVFLGGETLQIGICDDQKEIREMMIDKVKKIYPAEVIVSYGSGQELLNKKVFANKNRA